jgi:hypothetical protein
VVAGLSDFGIGAIIVLGLLFLGYQWMKMRGHDRPTEGYIELMGRQTDSIEKIATAVAIFAVQLESHAERSHDEHEGLRMGLAGAVNQTSAISKDYTVTLQKTLEAHGHQLDRVLDFIAPREPVTKRAKRSAPAPRTRRKVQEILDEKQRKGGAATA